MLRLAIALAGVVIIDYITTLAGVVYGSFSEYSILPRIFIEKGIFHIYPLVEFSMLLDLIFLLRVLQRILGRNLRLVISIIIIGVAVDINNILNLLSR
jgi:hypothetical protein